MYSRGAPIRGRYSDGQEPFHASDGYALQVRLRARNRDMATVLDALERQRLVACEAGSPTFHFDRLEPIMSRYVVKFFKTVIGDNGREEEISQCVLEVNARNKTEAGEIAKKDFCKTQCVSNWLDHADRMDVKEADFPS